MAVGIRSASNERVGIRRIRNAHGVGIVPAATNWLQSLGHAPRVLIVSESILNSSFLVPRLQTLFPTLVADRRSYGGSETPIGMLTLAADAQAYVDGTGNLLPYSDLTHWINAGTNLTVEAAASPTSGLPAYKLTGSGVNGQRITTPGGAGDSVVPAGAPPLVYSVVIEPGTLKTFQLLVYNVTKAASVFALQWSAAESTDRASLPTRFDLPVTSTTGAGYAAGDVLRCYLYVGPGEGFSAGYLYASNPMLNVGGLPALFSATNGTAQPAGVAGWQSIAGGTDRSLFDLVVIQFGRNDANNSRGAVAYQHALEAMLSSVASWSRYALVCTCPPKATNDLTAWDDANDAYQLGNYAAAAQAAAAAHGAGFYNAVDDFHTQVSSGSYTVAQIMRDNWHPTDSSNTSPGMGLYVSAIRAYMRRSVLNPVSNDSVPLSARVGGQPVTGTWVWTTFTGVTVPTYDAHGILVGMEKSPNVDALTSSTAGDQLTYTVSGSTIGVIILADQTTGGIINVSVDGGAAVVVNCLRSGLVMYPLGVVVATGLADTSHTVTLTVSSGECRVVGVVSA